MKASEEKAEEWRDIPTYEGIYQVSNIGNIKSLSRKSWNGKGLYNSKGRVLKLSISAPGYISVGLSKKGIAKTHQVHQLVAMAFLNHKPNGHKIVINHKNFNKLDNRVTNIELVTHRQNSNQKHLKSNSKYTGVYQNKKYKNWQAQIYIDGKSKHLGMFKYEYDAYNAYQKELKLIEN